jgi:type III restriction enzyme
MSFDDFVEAADYAVIEDAFKRAGRTLTPDLARTYSEHLAKDMDDDEDDDGALIEAHTIVAALGLVPEIEEHLETAAKKLTDQWLAEHRVGIKGLKDQRQDVYRQIVQMGSDPAPVDIAIPKSWLQPTTARAPDGAEFELPRFEKHLMSDAEGLFPEHFTSAWEEDVVNTELSRDSTVGWYRNPGRASQDSLGITYEMDRRPQIMRPDFIFFRRTSGGQYRSGHC